MGGEILALDEAEGTGNIRSDLSRARQRIPAAKDPDAFRKFVLRTALEHAFPLLCIQFIPWLKSSPCPPLAIDPIRVRTGQMEKVTKKK